MVVIWGTNSICHDSIHFYWLEDVSLLKYNIESFLTVACWYDKTYETIHNMLTYYLRALLIELQRKAAGRGRVLLRGKTHDGHLPQYRPNNIVEPTLPSVHNWNFLPQQWETWLPLSLTYLLIWSDLEYTESTLETNLPWKQIYLSLKLNICLQFCFALFTKAYALFYHFQLVLFVL